MSLVCWYKGNPMLGSMKGMTTQELQDQARALQGPFSLAMGVFSFALKLFDRVKGKKKASKKRSRK